MKLLNIRTASLANENMRTAVARFAILLKSKTPRERCAYCNNIQALLDDCPLSDWFSLYVRCIFNQIYQDSLDYRNQFLDVISNLRLNKLSNEYHGLQDRISLLESSKLSFFHNTYPNTEVRSVFIGDKISRWKRIQIQSKEQQLGVFLLLEKIVLCLEQMDRLPEETIDCIIKKMSEDKDLVGAVVAFVPLLLELQRMAPDDPADVAIPIVERVIDSTLKLLGFDGDNQHLVSLIKDDLFESKYLDLVDATPQIRPIFDDSDGALSYGTCTK